MPLLAAGAVHTAFPCKRTVARLDGGRWREVEDVVQPLPTGRMPHGAMRVRRSSIGSGLQLRDFLPCMHAGQVKRALWRGHANNLHVKLQACN
jgi:hypothetical protein